VCLFNGSTQRLLLIINAAAAAAAAFAPTNGFVSVRLLQVPLLMAANPAATTAAATTTPTTIIQANRVTALFYVAVVVSGQPCRARVVSIVNFVDISRSSRRRNDAQ
jgi:hypothetical protein